MLCGIIMSTSVIGHEAGEFADGIRNIQANASQKIHTLANESGGPGMVEKPSRVVIWASTRCASAVFDIYMV